jgi:hypothetical protein
MHNVTTNTKLKLRGRDFHLVEFSPTEKANSNASLPSTGAPNKIWLPFLPDDTQDTIQKWLSNNNVSTQGLAVLDLWPLIDWWREQKFPTLQLSALGTLFSSLFLRDSEYIVLPLNQARHVTYSVTLKDAVLRAPLPIYNLHLTDSVVHATKPLEHSGMTFVGHVYLSLEEKPNLRAWSTTWEWRYLKPRVATATRPYLFETSLNLAPNELNLIHQRRRAALYSGSGSPNAISLLAATNPKDPLHSFLAYQPFHKTTELSMMLPDAYPLMATMVENENENGQEGSKNTEPKVRYWQDETSFRYGRYTVSRLGAYLTKYWQHAFSAVRIQELVEGITHGAAEKAEQILFARTREEIEEVYLRGPHSCMRLETTSFEGRPVYESGIHPSAIYASPDFAVAYLKDPTHPHSTRIVARALTRESTKTFVRVYDVNDSSGQGPHGKALRSALIFKGYRQDRAAELPKGSDGPLSADAFHVFVPAFRDTGTVIAPYLDVGDGSGLGAGGIMVYTPAALAAGDIIPESVTSTSATMDNKDPLPEGWRWWPALYAGRSSPIDKVASLQSDGYLAHLSASSLKGAYYLRDDSYSDNATGTPLVSYGDGYRNDDDDEDEDSEETDTRCVISEDWFYSYGTDYSTVTVITGTPGHYYVSQGEAMDSNIECQTGNHVDDGAFTTNTNTYTHSENVVLVNTDTAEIDLVEPMAKMVSTFCPLFELYIGTAGARQSRGNTYRPSLLLLPRSSFDAAGSMTLKAADELHVSNAENLNNNEIFTKIVVRANDAGLFGEHPEEIWYCALAPYTQHFNERDVTTKVLSRGDEPNTHQSVIWLIDAEKTPSENVMEVALVAMLRPEHPYFAGYTETPVVSGVLSGVRLRHIEHNDTMTTIPWYTAEQPILVSRD